MSHALIFNEIAKKLSKDTSSYDLGILEEVVLGVGNKGSSLSDFYKEVCLYKGFLNLGAVNEISKKYAVHIIYRDYIDKNYHKFEETILAIARKVDELAEKDIIPSFDLEAWNTPGTEMFSRTDLLTIEKLRGLKIAVSKIYEMGYRQFMRRMYSEAADERAVDKYTIAFAAEAKLIGKVT